MVKTSVSAHSRSRTFSLCWARLGPAWGKASGKYIELGLSGMCSRGSRSRPCYRCPPTAEGAPRDIPTARDGAERTCPLARGAGRVRQQERRPKGTHAGRRGRNLSRDTHRQTWKPRTQRSRRPVSTETVSCQGTLDGAADVTTNVARRFSPGGVT